MNPQNYSLTGRNAAVADFLDHEHFHFRRRPDAKPEPTEVSLASNWTCRREAPSSALTLRMEEDFRRFCDECLEVDLRPTGKGPAVIWILRDGALPTENFDRQDPEVEAFEIEVSEDRIEIRARHERGLLHGTHALEWLMADRGGPFLAPGIQARRPAFQPRISNGVFVEGHQTLENPGWFSDDYLSLMSHYGANGIHLFFNVWEVFHSKTLPELNAEKLEERIAALRAFNQRTLRFGIDVYLNLTTHPLMDDHPVFRAHPETRGALVEIFMEEMSGRPWYNLCSGSETVLRAYEEVFENLFTAAPELAGALMIIGGECFFHCFTRPAKAGGGTTNCRCCQGQSPSEHVARLTNVVAGAIKKTGSHKALYAWPYSAWVWSSRDPAEVEWVSRLSPDVSLLSNFDGYDEDTGTGAGVRFFDYNITCIGPSTTFARQAEQCRKDLRPIFSKVETCTTPEAFFLPYLPVHQRWLDRALAMKKAGVAGLVGQWRFFGLNGSPPEELQYRVTWQDDPGSPLEIMSRREFGLTEEEAAEVAEGWRQLSLAWESFPYSAMTTGERAPYMRGPFYLGPAHPLIFDVQDAYDLPPSFRQVRGDAAEFATPAEMEALQRKAKPRYISDLLVTLPFGVDRYLELLGNCRNQWAAGLKRLKTVLRDKGERAALELGVIRTIDSHLRSLDNVVQFYHARDVLQNSPGGSAAFKERIQVLLAILDDEIANAECMLPILERDPRLGFGFAYGAAYDAAMVRAKIAQCRFVRDMELPRISHVIRFHTWLESP